MCCLLSFKHEMRVHPKDNRNQPRRLLLSITSFSANYSNQLGEAMEDPKKSVELDKPAEGATKQVKSFPEQVIATGLCR
jgi:hypothetical protein